MRGESCRPPAASLCDERPLLQTPISYTEAGSVFSLPPPGPCFQTFPFQSCSSTEGQRLTVGNEQVLAPVQVTRRCSVFQNGCACPTSAKSQKPRCEQGPVCKPQHIVMYLTRARARKIPSEGCK